VTTSLDQMGLAWMLKQTEKRECKIKPCRVDKELLRKASNVVGDSGIKYVLTSKTRDIESDKAELFFGSDWPQRISEISIFGKSGLGEVCILLAIDNENERASKIEVKGSDITWVEGVFIQLKTIFDEARTWYFPFAEYRYFRALCSFLLVLLLAWRTYRFFPLAVTATLMPEIYFFLVSLIVWLGLGTYPLYRFLAWLFPYHEMNHSVKKKLRGSLGAILLILGGWILTNWLFPALIP
jgi:hypothetical protein